MDINAIMNTVTVVAAAATLVATQILKSKLIPVPFQNAPVPTTIAVSLIATFIALAAQDYTLAWNTWQQAVGTFVVVLGISAVVYNNTIRNWPGVKALEAPKQ